MSSFILKVNQELIYQEIKEIKKFNFTYLLRGFILVTKKCSLQSC